MSGDNDRCASIAGKVALWLRMEHAATCAGPACSCEFFRRTEDLLNALVAQPLDEASEQRLANRFLVMEREKAKEAGR